MTQMSGFNQVLNKVLTLTEATTTECSLLLPDTPERYQCEGKLIALHQVIEFFLEIDRRAVGEEA